MYCMRMWPLLFLRINKLYGRLTGYTDLARPPLLLNPFPLNVAIWQHLAKNLILI